MGNFFIVLVEIIFLIFFRSVVKNKKKSLYTEYLQQTVSDQDI